MALGDFVASKQGCQNEIMDRAHIGPQAPPMSALNNVLETDKGIYVKVAEAVQDREREALGSIKATYIPRTVYFSDTRRAAYEASTSAGPAENGLVSKWRMKDSMKTGSVALVLCLNIGVDPPDVIKISPCARMECWIDPFSMSPQKALDAIGKTLQAQYERWQPGARYKLQLDPTAEDIKKLCTHCRKSAKSERVLFHYNGHGVPKPTVNGEIWLFNKSYTQYIPLSVYELESWLGTPSIYVFDCCAAGMILDAFCERPEGGLGGPAVAATKDCILLAACGSHESLPQNAELPADVFTSCLTTPIKISLKWFCQRSLLHDSLDPDLIDKIPGRQNHRKTPLGELNWIFTAITDTIAWNVLPRDLFQRLFRQDLLVASLFRNFLLAERIMRTANCCPRSYPHLPPTHKHPMWQAWDMAAEICLSQLPALLNDSAEFQSSPFFTEQLTAFEVWLEHGSERKKPPEQLPIILQALLSQSHRFRALVLLGKFLDMGAWAVDLALSVGIFPYVLKLLRSTATELWQILVFIWTKILALDKSCQVDLVKDGGHQYFITFLDSPDIYPEQRAMAAFVLAVIVDGHRNGQEKCIDCGLITVCLRLVQCSSQMDVQSDPLLRRWLCLCLGKLWDGFLDAQQQGLQANAHTILMQLLSEPHPEVRAAATFALGTLIAAGNTEMVSDTSSQDDDYEDEERQRANQEVGNILLKVLHDGSPLVRAELAIGLSRLAIAHNKLLKPIAVAQMNPPSNLVLTSLPPQMARGGRSMARNHSPGSRVGSDGVMPFHVSLSSPSLATSVVMQGAPTLGGLSYPPEGSRLLLGNGITDKVAPRPKEEADKESTFYVRCIQAICVLERDPSPYVSRLACQVLRSLGVERMVVNSGGASSSTALRAPAHNRDSSIGTMSPAVLSGIPHSCSWIDLPSGKFFRTPPASPLTGQSVLAVNGMRRVCSLEFSPHLRKTADTGLADTALVGGEASPSVESVLVPCSNLYRWSCTHFSRPLLEPFNDDGDEEAVAHREERERLALDGIFKCQNSHVTKCSEQLESWDIKPQAIVDAVLLHPFTPIVCAADHQELIRVWDYEERAVVNTFENHSAPDKGVAKMFFLNELDDSLLLVASKHGCVRVWKDYCQKGEQQLLTTWQTLQGHRSGTHNVNAVVDWQQLRGYLYASGESSTIRVWDLNQELVACSLFSQSDSTISALSSHQGQCEYATAGYSNGSIRVFDTRSRDLAGIFTPHQQKVVGISFLPGIDSTKIVSASVAGDMKFIDIRQPAAPYMDKGAPPYGPLSVMAVHRHAPFIATGSPKQMIKVYNLQGEQLSVIYRNSFNSFLGQRIGPVYALSFHPYKIYLAAGDAESNVAIYCGDNGLA